MAGEETCWVSLNTIFVFLFYYSSIRNPSLDFVAAPALAPAEVSVDAALMDQYKQELERVRPPHVPEIQIC